MQENEIKERIRQGRSVVGSLIKLNDPSVVELLALAGYDFFVLDNEHVAMDREALTNIIRAADAAGITPIVRVRENNKVEILQALDIGAMGIQVPNVDTPDQAQELVGSVKYAPEGYRGFSPSIRAAQYGTMCIAQYIAFANKNTMIISQCESTECIENIDRILSVEGIDVVFIGPMDLSQSLGLTGDVKNDVVIKNVNYVIEKVLASGKAVGTVAANADAANELIQQGVQYILIGSDQGAIIQWSKNELSKVHQK